MYSHKIAERPYYLNKIFTIWLRRKILFSGGLAVKTDVPVRNSVCWIWIVFL